LLLVEQLTLITQSQQALPNVTPFLNRLSDILLDTVQDRTGQLAVAAVEILLNLRTFEVGTDVVDSLRKRLLTMMRNNQANIVMRVHAAQLVAQLGDTRVEVMDVNAIDFVPVKAGSFLMGSDPMLDHEAFAEEFPQQLRTTGEYAISRYPISNAQYRRFFDDKDDGYCNPTYWPVAISLGHWHDGMVWRLRPVNRADGAVDWQPHWAREPNQPGWPINLPNSPIMGISWYEARAFVRWLEKRWRCQGIIGASTRLDLPSEVEWEKAARGVDGRIYPWGNNFDGNRLNWFGHMLMAPAPIGAFPASASPYGVEEMVGNLWEWTRSVFEPYDSHYQSGTDFVNHVAPDVNLAVRGGAYFSVRARCRCAARLATLPYGRMNATFRIVRYDS
jgi:formylglycine-generating enzyme required for sulfatase activity